MEEKVLIKSERYNVKKLVKVIILVGIALSLCIGAYNFIKYGTEAAEYYDDCLETYDWHEDMGGCPDYDLDWFLSSYCSKCRTIIHNPVKSEYVCQEVFDQSRPALWFIPAASLTFAGVLIYFVFRSYELTVTDKRVIGRVAWGKSVNLPLDSVSAVAATSFLKGVAVSTPSGKISFFALKNADDIYNVISELMMKRQQAEKKDATASDSTGTAADELKKFKELLDNGVISQEEFDAKKKQLLGL